jgi:hypothetical protein
MTLFPGTPKVESPNYLGFGLPGLWASITSRPKLGSRQSLNQHCSSSQELSNAMSHTVIGRRKKVDSRF